MRRKRLKSCDGDAAFHVCAPRVEAAGVGSIYLVMSATFLHERARVRAPLCSLVRPTDRRSRRICNCVRACVSLLPPPSLTQHPRGSSSSMYPLLLPGPSPTSLRSSPLPPSAPPPHFYFSPALPLLRASSPFPPFCPPPPLLLPSLPTTL